MEGLEYSIMGYVASYLWPFVRTAAMLGTMFILGSSLLSARIRLILCISVAWCLSPLLPASDPHLDLFSISGILITINQIIIGIIIGYCTELISQCFVMAGQVIAMQTGLGFASVVDPVNGAQTPVVGQFFTMLCGLVFFGIDGHLVFIDLLRKSFFTVPVGLEFVTQDTWRNLFSFLGVMFQTAVNFSIASICTMLVINFTFGVMTRAAPQLNIFSMGFAVSLILGIFVLWVTVGNFMSFFHYQFDRTVDLICSAVGYDCRGGF